MREIFELASRIKLVIFDVDGVLTNGQLLISSDGSETKSFHARDGHGMKMLMRNGVDIAIISGRSSPAVVLRMNDLGVSHVQQGIADKSKALDELMAKLNIEAAHIAYVGDDVIDLPVMRRIGLAIAVQNADSFVKKHAHWQTPAKGGYGAAREVCELILEAQGKLDSERKRYL